MRNGQQLNAPHRPYSMHVLDGEQRGSNGNGATAANDAAASALMH
jgi:hypothetical protein